MKKAYHFIGIGGIGMSGLARILLSRHHIVTGSDLSSSAVTEALVNAGAAVFIGHAATHISPEMTVVYSSDIKKDNPEYIQALQLQCTLMHRSELLQFLTLNSKSLAVAGTHGKTTTSSLLASVLIASELDPTFVVGGIVNALKTNARPGLGDYFVVEADESDGTFLNYHPFGAIITNIDFDHMNHFKTEEFLLQSFHQFAQQVSSTEHFFWCGDDARLSGLKLPGISYGFQEGCQLRVYNFQQNAWSICFDVEFRGHLYSQIEVSLIGQHNALNALAVFGLALNLGISEDKIRKGLCSFHGVGRRCEKKGEVDGILFLDDYAHHPTEIEVTLKGIRQSIGSRRLIGVVQPHRYSRVIDCLGTYGTVFEDLDELFLTDIYGSGETAIPGLTYLNIFNEIKEKSSVSIQYVPRANLGMALAHALRPNDVVVTLGAGDVTKVCGEIMQQYSHERCHEIAF